MRNCPTHGTELVEKLLWDNGKKIGRIWYCPSEECGYQVTPPKEERPVKRKKGQSALEVDHV